MKSDPEETLREIDTLNFPFLGSMEDGELFQYLLLSVDNNSAKIALLQWFINRIHLHIDDKIDLHLPTLLSMKNNYPVNVLGKVVSVEHNEEMQGDIYLVSLSLEKAELTKDDILVQQMSTMPLTELLIHFLRDSIVLKEGIKVYFKHLIPYFSRIGGFSRQEYAELETYFLRDIEIRIINNEAQLEKLYQIAKQQITKLEEISIYIDLEALRELIESETSLSLFNVIFSQNKKNHVQELPFLTQPQYGVLMYINAIKSLERRLYTNYNNIVMIYLKSLK